MSKVMTARQLRAHVRQFGTMPKPPDLTAIGRDAASRVTGQAKSAAQNAINTLFSRGSASTGKVVVNLNITGINAVMSGPGAQSLINEIGIRMAENAGEGFQYVALPHKWTARGYVQTADETGRTRQADDAVLERTLGSK